MGKHQHGTFAQIWPDIGIVNVFLQFIRCQDHHHIGPTSRLGNILDLKHLAFSLGNRTGALAQTDANLLDPTVAQVQHMGVALRTVADNGHFFGFNQFDIRIAVIKHVHKVTPENGLL